MKWLIEIALCLHNVTSNVSERYAYIIPFSTKFASNDAWCNDYIIVLNNRNGLYLKQWAEFPQLWGSLVYVLYFALLGTVLFVDLSSA